MQNPSVPRLCLAVLWISMGLDVTGPAAVRDVVTLEPGLLLTRSESAGERPRRRFTPLGAADPVRSALIDGTLAQYRPQAGDGLEGQDGWTWKQVEFGEDGGIEGRGYYLSASIESDAEQVLILNASGHSESYVNGAPRGGDIYNRGDVHLPMLVAKGTNPLFLRAGRGRFKIRLYKPRAQAFLLEQDTTLPDLVAGDAVDTWGAVIVVNATAKSVEGLTLVLKMPGLMERATAVPAIAPLSIRKVGFRIQGSAPAQGDTVEGTLELRGPGGQQHNMPLSLRVVQPEQARKVTFISMIDGSVQYYGLRQATPLSPDDPKPAVVLTCHGAGVQGLGQSAAYSSKSWFHIVAPTNRRPFGYDWEDYGRADAMEVLDLARASLPHDPSRVYLTGHSMGGHGAWHLGVTYPDRFAAVGPSAGWLSRSSYVRRQREEAEESALEALVKRCEKSGDTIALARNLKHSGVYILHGADDNNVRASQAQRMAEVLGEFHHDWVYHEERGQGHWWGNEYNDGGSACVDWPFMFDLFARHALPPSSSVRDVEFVTANPGVSSQCHWLAIEGQIHHLDLSKAHVHTWPGKRLFQGTTENVAVLRLDVGHLRSKEPITVTLDEQTLSDIPYPDQAGALWLRREEGRWQCIAKPPLKHKGPHRYGSIKDELKHRFLFIYGTHGSDEENAWAFDKARYDAETYWYRGNGSVEIVKDSDFDPARYRDRTVVLYGNAQTNGAWPALLSDSPVQVRPGQVQVGTRSVKGDDLSAIFIRPRADSNLASVVVVSGTGPVGMRSTYFTSFFTPFVRYPDC
ncbi:MAG: prolyl oligopeptidase family serine peptidase, partial [Phycisphaerales bacterium]